MSQYQNQSARGAAQKWLGNTVLRTPVTLGSQAATRTRPGPDQTSWGPGSLSTFGAQAQIAFPGEAFSSSFAYIVELKQTFIS